MDQYVFPNLCTLGHDLGAIQLLDLPTALICEIFEEMEMINNAESLMDILNTSRTFDDDKECSQNADSSLQELLHLTIQIPQFTVPHQEI